MENHPYEDYMKEFVSLANVANVVYTAANEVDEDHKVLVDRKIFEELGRPSELQKADPKIKGHILDIKDPAVLIKIADAAVRQGFQSLTSFQKEICDSLNAGLILYNNEKINKNDFIFFIRAVYMTLLSAVNISQQGIYKVSRVEIPKELLEAEKQIETLRKNLEKEKDRHNPSSSSKSELSEELRTLRNMYRSLDKKYAHELQNAERAKEETAVQRDLWSRNKEELARLRELLFELDQPEEPAETQTSFPIHTEKNIYVFGGSPSWTKQIKELLPDLKYIPSDQNIKLEDKLSSADEIWFQWRALSHAQFYQAVALADNLSIPIKYFKFHSPKLCAEQFAKDAGH